MNESRLSQICDTTLEAGWLLGVTITPVFFNVYSSRVFEPDKLTTLRALAVVLAVFWLVPATFFAESPDGFAGIAYDCCVSSKFSLFFGALY